MIFSQVVFQILHHIEMFPPAIQNFKTGLLVVTTDFTIIKRYGVAQSRATPYQFVLLLIHSLSKVEIRPLSIFYDLRFGILFEYLFGFFDVLGRKIIIGK